MRCHGDQAEAEHATFDTSLYSGLIVLGGGDDHADNRNHYLREKSFIRAARQSGRPILGICLGAQLMALEWGGSLTRGKSADRHQGWFGLSLTPAGRADPVLGPLRDGTPLFQRHSDSFNFPEGAAVIRLATSSAPHSHCEAFCVGKSYGLQFHPELTPEKAAEWHTTPPSERSYHAARQLIDAWLRQALAEAGG
jgi:GMP synthase (glutamine-hydrolysing)